MIYALKLTIISQISVPGLKDHLAPTLQINYQAKLFTSWNKEMYTLSIFEDGKNITTISNPKLTYDNMLTF